MTGAVLWTGKVEDREGFRAAVIAWDPYAEIEFKDGGPCEVYVRSSYTRFGSLLVWSGQHLVFDGKMFFALNVFHENVIPQLTNTTK